MSENFNMESRSVAGGSNVDWEQRYRQGETPWEKGAPHPALIQWLNENPLSGRVLVPGCGFGHDVRTLSASGAEVLGLDIAPLAIAVARAFPRRAALLEPGGHFLAIFFLNPDHDEEGPPYGCHVDELGALFWPSFELVSERGDCQPTQAAKEESSCACW